MLSNCISKSLDCGMYFLTLPQTCAMKFQLKNGEPSTISISSSIMVEFDPFPDVV